MQRRAQRHARRRAARTARAHDRVKGSAALRDFAHAVHIADRPQRVRAAAGNLVCRLSQLVGDSIHLPVNVVVAVRVHKAHVHAHQVIQHLIAPARADAALFEHQHGLHAQLQRAGRRKHGVVGLRLSGGHHQLVPLRLRVGQQIFQLAHLVSAQRHAAKIVPLNPYVRSQLRAHARQAVQRRGIKPQRYLRKFPHWFLPSEVPVLSHACDSAGKHSRFAAISSSTRPRP